MQVEVPEQLKDDLASQMKEAGIPVPDSDERWGMALDALKVRMYASRLASLVCLAARVVQSCAVSLQWA